MAFRGIQKQTNDHFRLIEVGEFQIIDRDGIVGAVALFALVNGAHKMRGDGIDKTGCRRSRWRGVRKPGGCKRI